MPRPCMHCENPPCVKVCPTGARFSRDDGFVLTDQIRCIGCRFCQVACPYGVNYFMWKSPTDNQYYSWRIGEGDNTYGSGSVNSESGGVIPPYKNPDLDGLYGTDQRVVAGGSHFIGVMTKCTWCVHRVENGRDPACVENCPAHVLHFGDIDDPTSEVSILLGNRQSMRLAAELNTKPSVYYLTRE